MRAAEAARPMRRVKVGEHAAAAVDAQLVKFQDKMSTACHTAPVEAVSPIYTLPASVPVVPFLRNEALDNGTDSTGVVMSSTKTGASVCVSASTGQVLSRHEPFSRPKAPPPPASRAAMLSPPPRQAPVLNAATRAAAGSCSSCTFVRFIVRHRWATDLAALRTGVV